MTWKSHGLKIKIDPDFFYLLEALRVEGYWSVKNREASIDNKNIPLLKNIERILRKNNVNYTKRIIIKIRPRDQNFNKKDIKVIYKRRTIGFHLERSPFDKSKKIVFRLPHFRTQKISLRFKKRKVNVIIKEGKEKVEIKTKNSFKAFGYLEIRFYNAEFIRTIQELSNGKGSLNIRVNKFLLNFPPEFAIAAFGALIDCEGTIDFYRFFRKIRIRMFNLKYLSDWQKILSKLNINSRCNDVEGLVIEGWEDFNKLQKLNLRLFHSKKREKWKKMLNSYKRKQVSRNTALNFYLNKLKEVGKPISAAEFAKITNKSKRVINHHLKRLMDKNLIKVDKSNITWKYFI